MLNVTDTTLLTELVVGVKPTDLCTYIAADLVVDGAITTLEQTIINRMILGDVDVACEECLNTPGDALQVCGDLTGDDMVDNADITALNSIIADLGGGTPISACAWWAADVDGNGWMDLHVPNYCQPDLFYDNEGGTFTERAVEFGLADPWRGLESIFFDMDRDGDMDLYVSNDKKDGQNTTMHNRLYENRDGVLVDVSVGSPPPSYSSTTRRPA